MSKVDVEVLKMHSMVSSATAAAATTVNDDDDDESSGSTGLEDGIHTLEQAKAIAERARKDRKNAQERVRRAAKALAAKALAEKQAEASAPSHVKEQKAAAKRKQADLLAEGAKLCVLPTREEILGDDFVRAEEARVAAAATAAATQKRPQFAVGSTWLDQSVLDAGLLYCNKLLDDGKRILASDDDDADDDKNRDAAFNFRQRLKQYVTKPLETRMRLSRTFSHSHFSCDDFERIFTRVMREFAGDQRIIDLGLARFDTIGFVTGVLLQAALVMMMKQRASCSTDEAIEFVQQKNVRDESSMQRVKAESLRRQQKKRARIFIDADNDDDDDDHIGGNASSAVNGK